MSARSTHRARAVIASALVSIAAASIIDAGDALAQRPYRERPDGYDRGYERDYDRGGGRRGRDHEAGVFDYYVLALSWSPTFCADVGDARDDPQCRPRRDRPYAFVLHGLWPQYERGWPQDCRSADRGYVPRPVARRMLDIMPSEQLVFHEYRKHGTCSGLGVDAFFDLARRLYESVKIPPRFVGLTDPRTTVSTSELMRDFAAANPGLQPDMLVVQCGGAGNRLKEVRICFDKGGTFRACGRNENQERLCRAERMYVPPVRHGADGERRDREGPDAERLPERKGPPLAPDTLPGPRDERRDERRL